MINATSAKRITELNNGVKGSQFEEIMKEIVEKSTLGINSHTLFMEVGPDWTFIAEQLIDSGFKTQPVGLRLEISW